jgi:hypothetical protein
MITNNPTDDAYAKACQEILSISANLSDVEIDNRFREVERLYFPDYDTEPANLMLKEVHGAVVFDELDPGYSGADPAHALERIRKIIGDYLAGNFYPTYFSLSCSYGNVLQGYTSVIIIRNNEFAITCGNAEIRDTLHGIAAQIQNTGNDEYDLNALQAKLPSSINELTLTYADVTEYLA